MANAQPISNFIYRETFDDGPGGWMQCISNHIGLGPLKMKDGAVLAMSPWWIDYNHAPPNGGGYLHLLMFLDTRGPRSEVHRDYGGRNKFIDGNFPLDWTNARCTLRLKGEVELRETAQLCLLVQGEVDGICSGWVLTGLPFKVTREWSEQTVTLAPDPKLWTALGTRPERADTYGTRPVEKVLANVSTNMHIVLFPLDVAPMGPVEGDINKLRAGHDYPVWRSRLPEGYVLFDTVQIEFAKR